MYGPGYCESQGISDRRSGSGNIVGGVGVGCGISRYLYRSSCSDGISSCGGYLYTRIWEAMCGFGTEGVLVLYEVVLLVSEASIKYFFR